MCKPNNSTSRTDCANIQALMIERNSIAVDSFPGVVSISDGFLEMSSRERLISHFKGNRKRGNKFDFVRLDRDTFD